MNLIVHKAILAQDGRKIPVSTEVKGAYGNPKNLNFLADAIWKQIVKKKPTCVASTGYGGIPLASVIASRHRLKLTLVRDKLKVHGKRTWLEGYIPTNKDKVAIVDDKCGSKNTLATVIRHLKPTGAKIAGCYVVVDYGNREIGVPVFHLATEKELE
jgi:orotate phosphoribosyltransferase